MKNCDKAATVAETITFMPSIPTTAPPPRALKKVIALVMAASIRALPQSNFCSMTLVFSFAQQTIKPLIVSVGLLW